MWKMVWNDLRHGFCPGLKQILKQMINYYLWLYLLGLFPVISEFSGRDLLVYYAGMLPMLLAILFASIYGSGGNIVFYLCPLSEEERRRYFMIFWGIRAGIPVLLSILSEGLLCVLGLISMPTFWLAVLTVAFFSAVQGMYGGIMNREEEGIARVKRMPPGYTVWGVLTLMLGLFTMVFLAGVVSDLEKPRYVGPERIFFLILFFCHALAALLAALKYFRLVMERMVCYEDIKTRNPRKLP